MKRESPPSDRDIVFPLQFFNTPGNEITPGSDIVGKYFKDWLIWHSPWPPFSNMGDVYLGFSPKLIHHFIPLSPTKSPGPSIFSTGGLFYFSANLNRVDKIHLPIYRS
jgi:hypothetical protein